MLGDQFRPEDLDLELWHQVRETCDDGEPLAKFYFRPGAQRVNYGGSLDAFYYSPGARHVNYGDSLDGFYIRSDARNV